MSIDGGFTGRNAAFHEPLAGDSGQHLGLIRIDQKELDETVALIAVLGDDPLTFAPERFQELPVDVTIAGGKVVHTGAVRAAAGVAATGAAASCSCAHR